MSEVGLHTYTVCLYCTEIQYISATDELVLPMGQVGVTFTCIFM